MAEQRTLEELRRHVAGDPASHLFARLAEALRRNGEVVEAISVARQGLDHHPDHGSARITLGRALLDSGDPAGARVEFETVLRKTPGNVLASRLLGESLEAVGDEASALRHYRAALANEPSDEKIQRKISLLEQRSGAPPRLKRKGAPEGGGLRRPGMPDRSKEPIDYVDFADDGVVAPSKVPPMIESLQDPNSAVGEALRFLGVKVLDLRRNAGVKSVALTSAMPGEGKSTLSLSLAGAVARETDQRVLLIEADLRRPSITSTLGLPPAQGLSDWLENRLDVVPIRALDPGAFFVLVAGQAELARPELLGSPRMAALLAAAGSYFDFVVVDGIPALPVTDMVLLQDLVDGLLLVVRSRQTPRAAVRDALAKLRPDKVKGVVLNDHEEYRDSYKTYAYQRYGMSEPHARSRGRRRRR